MQTSIHEFAGDLSKSVDWLRVKELEEQQRSLLKSVICGFNQLLDLRDLNTGVHSTRLAEWAVRVAGKLGRRSHGCKWRIRNTQTNAKSSARRANRGNLD